MANYNKESLISGDNFPKVEEVEEDFTAERDKPINQQTERSHTLALDKTK